MKKLLIIAMVAAGAMPFAHAADSDIIESLNCSIGDGPVKKIEVPLGSYAPIGRKDARDYSVEVVQEGDFLVLNLLGLAPSNGPVGTAGRFDAYGVSANGVRCFPFISSATVSLECSIDDAQYSRINAPLGAFVSIGSKDGKDYSVQAIQEGDIMKLHLTSRVPNQKPVEEGSGRYNAVGVAANGVQCVPWIQADQTDGASDGVNPANAVR